MKVREYEHVWRCAGCNATAKLVTRVEEADIQRTFNPAPMIATKKMRTEQQAAARHASEGCDRPV